METASFMDRAIKAYFKAGGTEQPSAESSTIEEYKGLWFVVLRNCNGVLAVYRILNDETLKRLKRWSIALEAE